MCLKDDVKSKSTIYYFISLLLFCINSSACNFEATLVFFAYIHQKVICYYNMTVFLLMSPMPCGWMKTMSTKILIDMEKMPFLACCGIT